MRSVKEGSKYKLVPPEGGWGYVVAMGKVTAFLSMFGAMHGFALIFNDFLKVIGVGTSIVAILGSSSSGAMSFAGLFSNLLTQKFSKRNIGVVAAIAYCIGSSFQIFANSTWPLFVAAILHGAALGVMLPIVFSTFNHYFVERRAFITSATQILIGVGQVGAPLGVQYLLEVYGFRGCLAILTAINFHSVLGMLVMHPVEWHMKKVPITGEEKVGKNAKQGQEELPNGKSKSEDVEQMKPLMVAPEDKPYTKTISSLRASANPSRRGSFVSVADWAGSLVISEILEPEVKPSKKWTFIGNLLDLKLLKDLVYVNLVVGIVFTFYADFSFSSFQPLYLFEIDYTQVEVSQIIAVGTGADLVARCILTAVSAVVVVPPKLCFFVAVILSLVARVAFFYIEDFWGMVIITATIGFLKTWLHVPVGLIFAEYLPKERFATGYGLFMFLQGMFTLSMGPVIRYTREFTRSYIWVFHVLNMFMVITLIVWSVEYLCRRFCCSVKSESGRNSPKGA